MRRCDSSFAGAPLARVLLVLFGLLATGAFAGFGVLRLQRRRERFQRELRAVEHAFAMTRERAADCEAALAERKAHCRGLFLDGRLEEGQFALLERRIDELRASVRLQVLDARLEFLPLGMVRALQGMLEDGRISAWEHRHFRDALQRDRFLTHAQKRQVQDLIDEWFARDSAGGAAAGTGTG